MVEQEPGPWELMRAIQALEKKIDNITTNTVTAKVFEIYAQGVEHRINGLVLALSEERANRVAAIAQEKLDREGAVNSVTTSLTDSVKFRRQVALGVGLALFTAILGLVVGLVGVSPT